MAKPKFNIPAIGQIAADLKNGKILPVYFFFGDDTYSFDAGLALIDKAVTPFISSDFDKETFYGEDKNLNEILNVASAFPFGSGKKFLIIKDFEKIKDKKSLISYLNSPPDFTVLVIVHEGKISNLESEPFKTLISKNFIFEAKELKGEYLVDWLVAFTKNKGKIISSENARFLIDIVGENREMIEDQLDKIFIFLNEEKEITFDSIKSLSTKLKRYTIFDLQNAIGKKDKSSSLKIALNLLENGDGIIGIIAMLTKYFAGLSRINELQANKVPVEAAARIVGSHYYYYKDYLKARSVYSDKDLYKAVQALLKADTSVKTTSSDEKTILVILISEILS
ncbi:MAG: DNA polymerase III subunit delta [Bacteroidetes bacterium]|nr:DNA polymerase III subunit delta [Bacteroidota bacterium]